MVHRFEVFRSRYDASDLQTFAILRFTTLPMHSNRSRRLELLDINHEPIPHIRAGHSFVGLIDLVRADHFDLTGNVVLCAKVQHLLRFLDATHERSENRAPSKHECLRWDDVWLWWDAQKTQFPVTSQQVGQDRKFMRC